VSPAQRSNNLARPLHFQNSVATSRNRIRLLPKAQATALEIGARDGRVTRLLAEHFEDVTALDLESRPSPRSRNRGEGGCPLPGMSGPLVRLRILH